MSAFTVWTVLGLSLLAIAGLIYYVRSSSKPSPPSPTSLEEALSSTKSHFLGRLHKVFSQNQVFSKEDLENLEEALYTSDLGPKAVEKIMEDVRTQNSHEPFSKFSQLIDFLKTLFLQAFQKSYQTLVFPQPSKPTQVWMVVGVNGVGKTTTIGKLAFQAQRQGLKTLVIAGDRFRAAAESQLQSWTTKAQVDFFDPPHVKDPSAVIFDGCQKAKAKNYDLVIIDTAGRLHTHNPLMQELEKNKKVISKVFPEAPHEVLQVLDANSGQNALVQTEKFHEVLGLTGVILTKLDGSAKGGVALAIAFEHRIPVKAIGIGETVEDLHPFNPKEFVNSLISIKT